MHHATIARLSTGRARNIGDALSQRNGARVFRGRREAPLPLRRLVAMHDAPDGQLPAREAASERHSRARLRRPRGRSTNTALAGPHMRAAGPCPTRPTHGGSAATLDTPATWSRSGVRLSALNSAPAGKVESGFVARPPSRGVGSTWERATRRLAWRPEERREQDTSARAPPRLPVAGPRSSRPGPCLRLP